MPRVFTPVGCAEGETVRQLAACPRFCRRSMPNAAHKEESPGGWTDHSHCPWLSRLSRSVPRNSVTTSTVVGIEDVHPGRGNGSRALRKANIIGAHHDEQRAAPARDHDPGEDA